MLLTSDSPKKIGAQGKVSLTIFLEAGSLLIQGWWATGHDLSLIVLNCGSHSLPIFFSTSLTLTRLWALSVLGLCLLPRVQCDVWHTVDAQCKTPQINEGATCGSNYPPDHAPIWEDVGSATIPCSSHPELEVLLTFSPRLPPLSWDSFLPSLFSSKSDPPKSHWSPSKSDHLVRVPWDPCKGQGSPLGCRDGVAKDRCDGLLCCGFHEDHLGYLLTRSVPGSCPGPSFPDSHGIKI